MSKLDYLPDWTPEYSWGRHNHEATPDEVERKRADKLRRAFMETAGVRRLNFHGRRIAQILAQSGADKEARETVLRDSFGFCDMRRPQHRYTARVHGKDGNLFDHAEIHGRGRSPLFLIAHPYVYPAGVCDEDATLRRDAIDALRALGMTVDVLAPEHSFYGFRSFQVRVYHAETVKLLCDSVPE